MLIGIIKIRKFPSSTTSLLYIIDWLHVLTLWGNHQAFTMNHFVKKLHTFPCFEKKIVSILSHPELGRHNLPVLMKQACQSSLTHKP
jgi:hypothetical protein